MLDDVARALARESRRFRDVGEDVLDRAVLQPLQGRLAFLGGRRMAEGLFDVDRLRRRHVGRTEGRGDHPQLVPARTAGVRPGGSLLQSLEQRPAGEEGVFGAEAEGGDQVRREILDQLELVVAAVVRAAREGRQEAAHRAVGEAEAVADLEAPRAVRHLVERVGTHAEDGVE